MVVHNISSDFADYAQPDGDDFVFTTADGTKLNHEIERYDSSSGELVAWVNIPSLSSVDDTIFYIYYGNDGCSNQENVAGTWDPYFWMVQHLDEEGTGVRHDSTSNSNYGIPGNYDGDEATDSGKIDGGDYLDGSDDYMTFSGYPTWSTYTISCWIKLEDKLSLQFLFEVYSDYFMGNGDEHILTFNAHKDTYNNFITTSEHAGMNYLTSVAVDSEWHYFVGVKTSSNTADVYIDGNYQHTHTGTFDTPEHMVIGCDDYHDVYYTKGTYDEVRTSNIARSPSWISTEYNNQNDPESFITFGEQEAVINRPPYDPCNPHPEDGETDVAIDADLSWTGGDPDGDPVTYDVYFGTTSPPPKVESNQSGPMYDPGNLDFNTIHYWQIVAWDNQSAHSEGEIWEFTTVLDYSPSAPEINGQISGMAGESYTYTFVSVDPDRDDIFYEIDWGDGNVDPWDGPHESNELILKDHVWSEQGAYTIRARAKDVYGEIGEWGTLEVTMPMKQQSHNWWFLQFLQNHPRIFPLIRHLLGFD